MSKMNLQKLRQVCHRDEYDRSVMNISLFANPLSRVVFEDAEGMRRTAQLDNINGNLVYPTMSVSYRTDEDLSRLKRIEIFEFNSKLAQAFLPRLNQILVEHGFHEKYLAKTTSVNRYRMVSAIPFSLSYHVGVRFSQQIYHACYTDGREMRRAVEYQAKLNKT